LFTLHYGLVLGPSCVLKNVGVNQKGINKKLYALKDITDGNKPTKEH